MKHSKRSVYFGSALLLVGLTLGWWVVGHNQLISVSHLVAKIDPSPAKHDSFQWEYLAKSTDDASLQNELTAIGIEGWEVISVAGMNSSVNFQWRIVAKRRHSR